MIWLSAREALGLLAAGTLAGIEIAGVTARLPAQYLFGATQVDRVTLLVSAAVMLLIAAIAVAIPAARASPIDPMMALRQE